MKPRIMHIVMFKWKDGTTEEQISEIKCELMLLQKTKSMASSKLTLVMISSTRSKGLSHRSLYARFVNVEALRVYAPSEAHQRVVKQFIKPVSDDILAFDFEIS